MGARIKKRRPKITTSVLARLRALDAVGVRKCTRIQIASGSHKCELGKQVYHYHICFAIIGTINYVANLFALSLE